MRDNITLDSLFDSTNVTEYTHDAFEHIVLDEGRDFVHCARCGDIVTRVDSELCNECVIELRYDTLEYLDEFHASEKD